MAIAAAHLDALPAWARATLTKHARDPRPERYTPRQLEYKTGGPPLAENMYTEALLRNAFGDMEILHLREHDDVVSEGTGHSGMSALIDLAARKSG